MRLRSRFGPMRWKTTDTQHPDNAIGFLDLEGDPFARDGGREYLFGTVTITPEGPVARAFWAYSDGEERTALFKNV